MTKQMMMNTGMNITMAEITSIIECCLMNNVESTMSAVRMSLKTSMTFLSLNVR